VGAPKRKRRCVLQVDVRLRRVLVLARGHFIDYSPRAGCGSGLPTIAPGAGVGQ
jgi:hypothetical protein